MSLLTPQERVVSGMVTNVKKLAAAVLLLLILEAEAAAVLLLLIPEAEAHLTTTAVPKAVLKARMIVDTVTVLNPRQNRRTLASRQLAWITTHKLSVRRLCAHGRKAADSLNVKILTRQNAQAPWELPWDAVGTIQTVLAKPKARHLL